MAAAQETLTRQNLGVSFVKDGNIFIQSATARLIFVIEMPSIEAFNSFVTEFDERYQKMPDVMNITNNYDDASLNNTEFDRLVSQTETHKKVQVLTNRSNHHRWAY